MDAMRAESIQARRSLARRNAIKMYVKEGISDIPQAGDWVYIAKEPNRWAKNKAVARKSNKPWDGPYFVSEVSPSMVNLVGENSKTFAYPINRVRLWRKASVRKVSFSKDTKE